MIDADRNLLLGILALQVDFITRDDLIAAMRGWILEKHKPLGQVLVERGALSARFRDLLEPMVDAHVERHGGLAALSLASLSTAPSAVPPLTIVDDPDVRASLARVATGPTSEAVDSLATRVPVDGPPSAPGHRFRVLRPHARGGIGVIFVAHDRELNREVALKEIQDHHADNPGSRSRFLLEAEVTGGLEHPGIVPVYGLGHHADGRPYYAMRFIRGDSLKEAIDRFHRGVARGLAADRALALRKLLRRFLDVCDAMAYAHSRGVLHRDLKPGNIMLGKYGETLVVDWGLAKARGRRDPGGDHHAEGPLAPSSSSGTAETLPGSTIGTPAYMSPEQAAGDLDRLGPGSDVYSLGATLYSLLTGRAPFEGPVEEVLRRVDRGDFPRPRSVAPGVEPALEAICLKAMALRPEARYASPRALADDLERWIADEPVSAYRDHWSAPVARYCRRHRTTVVPVLGLVAALIVGSGLLLHYRAGWQVAEAGRARDVLDAARERDRAEEDHRKSLRAARREAEVRDGFGAIDRAREARAARRPGWSWSVVDELARARALGVGEPAALRDEAAAALGSLDVRPRAVHDPGIAIGWPAHHLAFAPDGLRLAAFGWRPSARVNYSAKVLDARTGAILRELHFRAKLTPAALTSALEAVEDAAYSPDGRWLAVATSSGRAHLWDESAPSADGSPLVSWDAHGSTIRRVAFAGGALFTASDAREVRRWEIPPGPRPAPKASHAYRASLSLERALEAADGSSLRVVADGALVRLDPANLGVLESTPLDASRYEFGWAIPGPGGLRCAGMKGWEFGLLGVGGPPPLALQGPRVFASPDGGNASLRFQPGGGLLLATMASGGERGARLWDLASGAVVATLPVRGHDTIGTAFSPDGRTLAITEERKIALHEVRGGEVRSALAHAGGPIRALAIAPDGSTLTCVAATAGLSAASSWETTTWDLPSGRVLHRAGFAGQGSSLSAGSASVAYHPGGSLIVATGNDDGMKLRDPAAGDWRTLGLGGDHPRAAFSGDGRRAWAITGGPGGVDRVVAADWAGGRVAEVWRDDLSTITSGLGGLGSIASAGPRVLVGGHNGTCYLFLDADAPPGAPTTWPAPRDPVTALALSPGGEWAAIGRRSGAMEVRAVAGGEPFVVLGAHRDAVGALAIAADGRTIASGSTDRTVRLWRNAGVGWGDPLTLPSEGGPALALAFAPDGRTLYTVAGGEAAVRAWHLGPLRDALAAIGLPWPGFPIDPKP